MRKMVLGKSSSELGLVEFGSQSNFDGSARERQGKWIHEENLS